MSATQEPTTTAMQADANDDSDDLPIIGDLFICRDYETKTFHFGEGISQDIDCLAAASTDFDLTGQIIWPIARATTWYLAAVGQKELSGQDCIELGAGAGLCGLLGTRWSKSMVLTDYEPEVLAILERNLAHASKACKTTLFNLSWGSDPDHARLASETGVAQWPVIIGADIVYWSESIVPLFESVAALLAPGGLFILGYFDRLSSNKLKVEQLAREKGLVWSTVDHASYLPNPFPAEFVDHLHRMTIYRFRWADDPLAAAEGASS